MENVFLVAGINKRLGDGSEVAHPEKVEMTKARTVKVAFPQFFDNLTADLGRVTLKPLNFDEITVNKLSFLGPQGSNNTADISDKEFHISSV
jgi:hypothetical protein